MPKFKAENFSLYLTKHSKRYSMKLNSLSHDIYLRILSGFSLIYEDLV